MKRAGFYIFFVFAYIITLLPFRVLYLLSDVIYILIYHLIGYRREVVEKNLKNAFPDKSPEELNMIGKGFYRHLCDLIVETLKIMQMSPAAISRRFDTGTLSQFDYLYREGKDIVALCGHYNNWEWFAAIQISASFQIITIYKPLKNRYFDRFILNLRTKYGTIATPMQNILRELVRCRKENIRTISGFLADQTPPPDENAYWTTFLNQETGFFRGAEKIAVKYDMPVIFVYPVKTGRGYYKLEAKVISEHPKDEAPDQITSRYSEILEELIRSKPEYWLWSHRRWKHKRPLKND